MNEMPRLAPYLEGGEAKSEDVTILSEPPTVRPPGSVQDVEHCLQANDSLSRSLLWQALNQTYK